MEYEVTLNGEVWTVSYVPSIRGSWGMCYHEPRVIEIAEGVTDRPDHRDVAIHELLHGWLGYHIDESFVLMAASRVDYALSTRRKGVRAVKVVSGTLEDYLPFVSKDCLKPMARDIVAALSTLGVPYL